MSPVRTIRVRVTLPYQDCSGVIQQWVQRCDRAVVYEHEADEDVSRTHVHMALVGCQVGPEALKRMWTNAPGSGNGFWSFSDAKDLPTYLVYMAKGILRPVLVKNYSTAEVEEHRLSWKPVEQSESKDPSEFMIKKVLARFDDIKSYQDWVDTYGPLHYGVCPHESGLTSQDDVFTRVRSETMKVYWGVNRRVPHASQYKIVAGTVFMTIMERIGKLDRGFTTLCEKWY